MQSTSHRARIARLRATILLVLPSVAYAHGSDAGSRAGYNPQADGSIVVSNNQTLTPAGTLVNPGVTRAKAVNPNSKTNTAAVRLMDGPAAVAVFNTVRSGCSELQQRRIDGLLQWRAYSADGTKLFCGIALSFDGAHAHVALRKGALGRLFVFRLPEDNWCCPALH